MLSAALRARITLASIVTRAVVSRLAGFWLALLVLGAVIFSPQGMSAKDVTRGLRAEPWIAAVIALVWAAAHVRATRVLATHELEFVRAIPLGALDRFATTALPRILPHAVAGGFFARAEGAAVGAIAASVALACTVAASAVAHKFEFSMPASRPSSRGLASAHRIFAVREAHSTLARVALFVASTSALAAVAIFNNRAPPTDAGLATVLLLLASGACAASFTSVVNESERTMELLLATQPNAELAAGRARRWVAWGIPTALGALSTLVASSSAGPTNALKSAAVFGLHWLSVAITVEQSARRGFEAASAGTAITIAWVLLALVAPLDLRVGASLALVAAGLLSSVRS